ncbi:MAG: AAA family ATPase [Lachnospiraceae bacterium]|nr:AAA family ATPase [Lachnospiraceae bacterium]
MNKEFLNALIKDRKESADTLEKPSMKGVKSSVIDKYTDQAHFIYELLQNADDTKATYARFKLYHDKLVFAHNGERHFSVSSPDSEEQDRENGRLGDVNAILSIGNSSKTSESTIGKFGVGFKAVFQYTSTPYIYDPEIYFKIERFIVPVLLESDYPERKAEETLFVFPFNHEVNTPDMAFEAIAERLCSLINPLLFLSHLKKIDFEFDDTNGSYQKEIMKEYCFQVTKAECINLFKETDDKRDEVKLWLFSRPDENDRSFSVGFFLGKNGKLDPVLQYAYCFFPTRETTGLNFIIHAPFLLTDSREGIKARESHNKKMIDLLAELAADSLEYLRDIGDKEGVRLIDDNIVDIIPVKSLHERNWSGGIVEESEFEPFYEKILNAFRTKQIIPAKRAYTIAKNAYWAHNHAITSIFDEEALQALMNDQEARWVFTGLPREKSQNREYIDSIIDNKYIDEDKILSRINSAFIKSRSIEWLSEFYNWIDRTSDRIKNFRVKPIFLDSKENAVPAYDHEGKLVLFLPTGEDNDYTTVNEKLLENEDIKAFLNSTIRITKPELKNEIYNKILPKFEKGGEFDSRADFKKLFEYYENECPRPEKDRYISELQKYDIVRYTTAAKTGCDKGNPRTESIYFPTEELKEYFKVKPSTKFLTLNDYIELVGKENEESLCSFLIKLGVSKEIRLIEKEEPCFKRKWDYSLFDTSKPDGKVIEKVIDGCSENIDVICTEKNESRSIFFWNRIVDFIGKENVDLNNALWRCHKYFYYKEREDYSVSSNVSKLRTSKWLCTKSGKFVSPSETYADALAEQYDVSTSAARQFINFLKMPFENPELSRLSPEQREDIEIARKIKEAGISDEELDELIAMHQQSKQSFKNPYESPDDESSLNILYGDNVVGNADENLVRTTYNHQRTNHIIDTDNMDSDEYMPKTVDYKKKIERAKSKRDAELDLIEKMEELQQKAMEAKRYTFIWFKTLLELETLNSGENYSNSREVSIAFGKAEPESSTNRTLILKYPTCYIPRFMEEIADIPLILVFEDETKKLPIEVINIKSYTLRVKLKPNVDVSNIDFSAVKEARITAQNPVFLLEELKRQFTGLNFDDDYNMQTNLCNNIDFIFGPPGTGKTTYLVNEIIIPKMKQDEDIKVLVLTPTNKAADVIVRKIQEVMENDDSYIDWLVRFGGTDDEEIERTGVYRDKTFDIRQLGRSVTVTTIDRFPYDFFMPNGERHYLRNQKWDYIIFDEASMIPLIKMIYPLYHRKPKKFIIAGDPFQIEPVVALDMWKGENIYSMVKLDSFAKPTTVPHDYDVKLLTTQYRSIPIIGEIVSKLTYDGILKHYRNNESMPCLNIENCTDVKPLNIIKFPVSKYESIYRSKRLGGTTPYQVYSALFTYEFTTWLSAIISQNNTTEKFSIGVIAAYKAQADLIDRLISAVKIPDNISIQTGTIHGFQGDECEIIISVYNPPPSISDSDEMFLNKKNIINVSISRAKDYLFVIMPDDDTENVNNLFLIKRMEQYIKDSKMYIEYDSHSIEKMIFGNSNYLEENSFSTSHQRVNVYSLLEQKYEIRSEEDTIDIQIH